MSEQIIKYNKTNKILQEAEKQRNEGRAALVNLESFTNALNRAPQNTKTNKYANNTQYIPISNIQTLLDQMFFGLWQTKNFTFQVIANELVGKIELWVYHPIVKDWIVRTGVAAAQIRLKSGAKLTDIDSKIKNSLEMDAPHLYADCVKSAAKTLGAAFGRDLNRNYTDNYKAMVSTHLKNNVYSVEETAEKVAKIETLKELNEFFDLNKIWQNDEEIISIFEERKNAINEGL